MDRRDPVVEDRHVSRADECVIERLLCRGCSCLVARWRWVSVWVANNVDGAHCCYN